MKYLTLGLYLLLFPFLILPRIVKINKLECYSQYGICGDEIFNLVNGSIGKNIRDAKKYATDKFSENNLVDGYSFTFKLPGTLRMDVIVNKAKFALYKKDTSEVVLLDKEGLVLEKTDKTNLPKVIVAEDLPAVSQKVTAEKLFVLNLIYSLNFLYQVDSGEITPDGLIVNLPKGVQVTFPLAGDIETLLGSLKLVLAQMNLSGKDQGIIVVDLRFKNPIIRK